MQGDDVYVVGAANSAGQAALNIARYARRVTLLVRADALEKSMSKYLVERIHAADNIEVQLQSEVVGRATVTATSRRSPCVDRGSGAKVEAATNWLFVFIGASPRTDWLGDDVARDQNGFVLTGQDLLTGTDRPAVAARPPAVRPRDQRARRVRRR